MSRLYVHKPKLIPYGGPAGPGWSDHEVQDFSEAGHVYVPRNHNTAVTLTHAKKLNQYTWIGGHSSYITLVANPGYAIYGLPKLRAYSQGPSVYDPEVFMDEIPIYSTSDELPGLTEWHGVDRYSYITWKISGPLPDGRYINPPGASTHAIHNVTFRELRPDHLPPVLPPDPLLPVEDYTIRKPSAVYINDSTIPKGEELLLQKGQEGIERVYYMIVKVGREQIRFKLYETIIQHARPDIYARGTGDLPPTPIDPEDPDDTRETIVIRGVRPWVDNGQVTIPEDGRVVYKNFLTGHVLEGTFSIDKPLKIILELNPDLPRDYIYKLEGPYQWDVSPDEMNVQFVVQMVAGFRVRKSTTGEIYNTFSTTFIRSNQFADIVKIEVDGEEAYNWVGNWTTPSKGGVQYYEQNAYFTTSSGYKEVKLTIRNPDFMWRDDRKTFMYVQGSSDGYKPLEVDSNGDLVWKGRISPISPKMVMTIYPFTEKLLHLHQVYAPEPTPLEGHRINIPGDSRFEYVDADTGVVLPPGDMDVKRFLRIRARLTKTLYKEDDTYYSMELQNDHTIWTFEPIGEISGVEIEAPAPKMENGLLHIPDVAGVFYWDNLAMEIVEGTIDLRTRPDQRANIKPFPRWETYTLTNPDALWIFTLDNNVTSVKPTQDENKITIPVVPGVQYFNKDTDVELSGTIYIQESIVVEARPAQGYTLMSTTNEWVFTPIEIPPERITAPPVKIDGNWVAIPNAVGVRYFNVETNEQVSGTFYVSEDMVIGAEPISDRYTLTNPNLTWSFTFTPTPKKEVAVYNRPSNLILSVDGTIVYDSAFEVDLSTNTSIVLKLRGEASFEEIPYIEDGTGEPIYFTMDIDNKTATLDISFDDDIPTMIYTPSSDIETYTLTFVGENTRLEVKHLDGDWFNLSSGGTATLLMDESYEFYIHADEDHVFDRAGVIDYQGKKMAINLLSEKLAKTKVVWVRDDVTISMNAVNLSEPSTPVNTIGFNNIYLVDKMTLNEISREMLIRKRQFMVSPAGAGGLNYDSQIVTDPHTYIINTIQLPFTIDDDMIANRQRVTMGYTTLLSSAPRLNDDKITLDLGEITTEPTFNNSYDYKHTSILLHLPYTNSVTIDPNYAIGETISIEYVVDAYTGHTTINLRSTLTGDNVFHTSETYIGNEIPFISMKDGSTVGSTSEIRTLTNNNTPTPYIEVVRNRPHQMDSIFNQDVSESVKSLENIKGRIIVHDIQLELDTTMQEVSTIKSILSNGVTIK